MKGSLIVVGFFILGVLAGRSGGLPSWAMDSNISFVALCGLLLFVGLGIGMNPDMKNDIKSLNPRLALLPVATILGSWLGAMVAYIIMCSDVCSVLHHRQRLCLLFVVEHLHNRIPRCRTGHNSLACQHHTRDDNPLAYSADSKAVRSAGSYIFGWRNDNGHHPTYHHTDRRPTLRSTKHLPRFRDRLHRAVRSDNVVLYGWMKKVES